MTPLPQSRLCPPSLQGGYHLESLSLSVCMTVQALLGDPTPPLSGPMVPHRRCEEQEGGKGLEAQGQASPRPLLLTAPWSPSRVCGQPRPLTGPASSSKVGVAWAGWWDHTLGSWAVAVSQNHLADLTPVLSPSTHSPEERPSTLLPGGPEFKAAAAKAEAALSSLLDQLCLHPTPPVRTAVALTVLDTALALPPDTLRQEGSAPQEEMQAWARWAE